ncbi:hypothetical protein K502DRAFT_345464 [Neoconidiobolus thromboides FSU 785]|nr:hypothetical protein K502DRAFT_345464 [Neoconidiobolus thromboides FSU 785]
MNYTEYDSYKLIENLYNQGYEMNNNLKSKFQLHFNTPKEYKSLNDTIQSQNKYLSRLKEKYEYESIYDLKHSNLIIKLKDQLSLLKVIHQYIIHYNHLSLFKKIKFLSQFKLVLRKLSLKVMNGLNNLKLLPLKQIVNSENTAGIKCNDKCNIEPSILFEMSFETDCLSLNEPHVHHFSTNPFLTE